MSSPQTLLMQRDRPPRASNAARLPRGRLNARPVAPPLQSIRDSMPPLARFRICFLLSTQRNDSVFIVKNQITHDLTKYKFGNVFD
jgi:hypothetical protein